MVVALVIVGWQLNDDTRFRVETPRYIKAKLVTLEQPKVRRIIERKPRPKPAKPAPAPAPKKQSVPEPVKRKTVPPRKAPEPKAIPIPKATAKPKPVAEPNPRKTPKPKPVPAKPAPKRQAVVEQERVQERQAQQESFALALAEEELIMQEEEDELLAANYAALIKERVEGTWSRPPSARKDMQVVLSILLVPTGEVVGVEVVKSSGNLAFDRSAIIAVEKAERFSELQELQSKVFESYFRRFTLVFKPEDLLL